MNIQNHASSHGIVAMLEGFASGRAPGKGLFFASQPSLCHASPVPAGYPRRMNGAMIFPHDNKSPALTLSIGH
jgi:hypothetical protein